MSGVPAATDFRAFVRSRCNRYGTPAATDDGVRPAFRRGGDFAFCTESFGQAPDELARCPSKRAPSNTADVHPGTKVENEPLRGNQHLGGLNVFFVIVGC